MQQAASPLRLYFILHTSYFILHTSYFILHTLYFTSYFILSTSYFIRPPLVMPALRSFAKVDLETQFIY